ncbi:MAG TPA: hypothetical protein VHI72_07580, partial [Hyphomicrobiaceae bacterium]|nr:hypothetical protein [Hyphomicrobiaceae bacterium]
GSSWVNEDSLSKRSRDRLGGVAGADEQGGGSGEPPPIAGAGAVVCLMACAPRAGRARWQAQFSTAKRTRSLT